MKKPSVDPCARRTVAMLLLAATALANTVSAQTKPQDKPANGAAAAKEEETISLSPFEVTADKDTGYAARETLAGTRIRTDLKDVGSAISVVTKEFMQDVGALNNGTLLQYTSNSEVAGTQGTYAGMGNGQTLFEGNNAISANQRLRGLGSADNTRDFFLSDIPWDSFNVGRVDIQRGPNSILFGLGSPAGIINAATNGAEYRDSGSVSVRTGSYGSFRSSIDVNQVLIENVLSLRVDGLWDNTKYQQTQAFKKDKRAFGTLRWDPKLFGAGFDTSIKVKAEQGKITANPPRTSTPYDSITPWFASTDSGGAGKYIVDNVYALGSNAATTNSWLGSISGQQTPTYFINGYNAEIYSINAGYMNNGFLKNDGTYAGPSNNAVGQRYGEIIYGLTSYQQYASNAKLPFYNFAQYKNKMLTDTSIFDFYKNLIDGNNKGQGADWNSYNIAISQTGWKDRAGIEFVYDFQKYNSSNWSLLGGAPTINVDVTRVMQDGSTNPNFGRAFVSTTNGGSGNISSSKRESLRGSAFAEFRTSDVTKNDFLVKLLGRHRFNFLASKETYSTESRNYNRYANDNQWDSFATSTTGFTNLFTYRAPVSLIYLTPSLKNATTAVGANVDPILGNIKLNSGPVYLFNSKWNSTVSPTAAYSIPTTNAYLNQLFNPTGVTTQVSNMANYVGWGNQTTLNTLSFANGDPLYTSASKTQREISSYASTWQGFMWKDSIVPTLGWRYDQVKTRSVNASPDNSNKGYLKLDSASYSLPATTPLTGIYKGHSLSGGVVAHINEALPKAWGDALPINISLTYNESQNFQAQSARVDLYNNPISNPAGKTTDYGILLSTKDNKFSFRAIKYSTKVSNATISTDTGFMGPIIQGLKFRNVFLYKLTGYTWDTRRPYGDPGPNYNNRNYWTQAYVDAAGRPVQTINMANDPNQYGSTVPSASVGLETPAQAAAHRDASITAWNGIQSWLDQKGLFKAWGFGAGPTTLSALTDRTTYEASLDPATNLPTNSKYMPDTASLANYGSITPSGYAITADQQSSGYEYELTANPLKNWRISVNASQTAAINTNIGGAALQELVDYMDTQMAGVAGDMRQYNGDYVANNEVRKNWSNWRGGYTLLKLQEKTSAAELRKWRYSVVTNYTFVSGLLKNVGLGGAYRWQDKVVLGYPVFTDSKGFAAYDLTKPFYGPSEAGVDLWASYQRKITNKVNWKIQLNVSNAGQSNGLIPITVEPDGTTVAGMRMKPVQEWYLTNTFSF